MSKKVGNVGVNTIKNKFRRCLLPLALLVLLASAAVQAQEEQDPADPQGADYDLSWWTVNGGAGSSSGGDFTVAGTAGQPEAGMTSGGAFALLGGFWEGTEPSGQSDFYAVYLPAVLNNHIDIPYFEGPWEDEDNDSYAQANGVLYSGRAYRGYPDDAKDYFSFYARSGGDMIVDLDDHTGGGVQLHLFYQSVDNRVAYALVPPYHLAHTGPAGLYYIYIYTASNYDNTTPYTLQVTYP